MSARLDAARAAIEAHDAGTVGARSLVDLAVTAAAEMAPDDGALRVVRQWAAGAVSAQEMWDHPEVRAAFAVATGRDWQTITGSSAEERRASRVRRATRYAVRAAVDVAAEEVGARGRRVASASARWAAYHTTFEVVFGGAS